MTEDRFENTYPAFYATHLAWYGTDDVLDECYAEVMVGFFNDEGGTAGEFGFRWQMLGGKPACRLEAFSDSWNALSRMPELMNWMKSWDQLFQNNTPEPEDLIAWLKLNGFRDETSYDSPFSTLDSAEQLV